MKLKLINVCHSREVFYREAVQVYSAKINHFVPFQLDSVKPQALARNQAQAKIEAESAQILKRLKPDDFVVLLDDQGKSFGSQEFARQVIRLVESGGSQVSWVVGGAFGVSDELKNRAKLKVSLSSLTMNHMVASVVLLEQIYRALTIWKGIPYHNE